MPRILKFSRFASLRELVITVLPLVLLVVGLAVLAYKLVDPTPPRVVTLSAGQENSSYERFARRYADKLKKQGIDVTIRTSQGAQENLALLKDEDSGVDIAFVQSGTVDPDNVEGLKSLGSLFTEPLWIFYRDKRRIERIADLKGVKLNIGTEGSGVPRMMRKILELNGLSSKDLKLSDLENTPATVELLEGRIDALVFSSAPNEPLIQMLLQTPGIKLFDFQQAQAYVRRFSTMTHVTLPRGIVDLAKDVPPRDVHLIGPTATLVARQDLHPALVELFVQAAADIHGGSGWFRQRGEFPNAGSGYSDIPLADDAEKYYRRGPPFLQRYLPFWVANLFERMWVVIVALGALLLPLSRIVPPLYVWRIRSRVFRWYGELRMVEVAIEEVPQEKRPTVYREQMVRLNQIEERVNQVSVPLSFAEELYGLRNHINLVRKRIIRLAEQEAQRGAQAEAQAPVA